jgi:hypothetical protein
LQHKEEEEGDGSLLLCDFLRCTKKKKQTGLVGAALQSCVCCATQLRKQTKKIKERKKIR